MTPAVALVRSPSSALRAGSRLRANAVARERSTIKATARMLRDPTLRLHRRGVLASARSSSEAFSRRATEASTAGVSIIKSSRPGPTARDDVDAPWAVRQSRCAWAFAVRRRLVVSRLLELDRANAGAPLQRRETWRTYFSRSRRLR